MKAIRFRCPRCRMQHRAPADRAGQLFACTSCFGPMTIPDAAETCPTEIPLASLVDFRQEPEPVSTVATPVVATEKPVSKAVERVVLAGSGGVILLSAGAILAALAIAKPPEAAPALSSGRSSVTQTVSPVSPTAPAPSRGKSDDPLPSSNRSRISRAEQVAANERIAALIGLKPTPISATPGRPAAAVVRSKPLVIRRRDLSGQDALRQQLCSIPEIKLSRWTEASMLAWFGLKRPELEPSKRRGTVRSTARGPSPSFILGSEKLEGVRGAGRPQIQYLDGAPPSPIKLFQQKQPELGYLSWRSGEECHLDAQSAAELEVHSRIIRNEIDAATRRGDHRPDPAVLRASLLGSRSSDKIASPRWDVPAAIPSLMQLLMSEPNPARLVLVELLGQIKGPAASKSLARLAIFDLATEVRDKAIQALSDRPAGEYRETLLKGLRYPWAPVADHSAEALASLEDRESIDDLIKLLDEPDPRYPRSETIDGKEYVAVRSLVQVNHLLNCLLCHAPAADSPDDRVRGSVPIEGLPLKPTRHYYDGEGLFVRADMTYLWQDFSVTQPVINHGTWPNLQRYDYMVAEQLAPKPHSTETNPDEERPHYPQRDSVLFALRNLTGEDHGDRSDAWRASRKPRPTEESSEDRSRTSEEGSEARIKPAPDRSRPPE